MESMKGEVEKASNALNLTKRFNYYWRLGATGFCFVFFGFASWLGAFFLVPIFRLFSRDKLHYKERVQDLISRFFRLFLWSMEIFGLIRITTSFPDKLQWTEEAFVVVANHPMLIDVVLLLSRIPRMDCIVKQALYHNFFLKGMVKSAGYICNSGNPKALLEDGIENVQAGSSLLIFPEGSRSLPEGLRDFKRGAARIALGAGCRILPITIQCEPPMLQKGRKWYEIPSRRTEISISLGEPIDPKDIVHHTTNPAIAARHLTSHLQHYFENKLKNAECRTKSPAA